MPTLTKKTSKSNTLIGITGEYLVAAELSKLGYTATVTLKNTKGVDILVTNDNAKQLAGIQVKTSQKSKGSHFVLNQKNQIIKAEHLFYVFVRLDPKNMEKPEFYIYPSATVASILNRNINKYCKEKGISTPASSMRNFEVSEEYLDNWKCLGL